ncbi:MAG: hypothetical protein QXD23_02235 [Candidatus Micrarchaeaceae archaeon]
MKNTIKISFSFLFLFLFMTTVYGQFGEIAGQPHFNVSLGSSQSLNITLINDGSTPINFKTLLPNLNQIVNTTTPIITAYPMNGTIKPNSDFNVNITVYMPYNKNKPGLTWEGVLQFVETSNSSISSGTGVQVVAGLAKIISITSTVPKSNLTLIIIFLIIVVIIVIVILYLLYKKLKNKKKINKSSSKIKTGQSSSLNIRQNKKVSNKKSKKVKSNKTNKKSKATKIQNSKNNARTKNKKTSKRKVKV